MLDSESFFSIVDPSQNIIVAFSGGVDSTALLNYCYELKQAQGFKGNLSAIHINHSISPHAQSWVEHCQTFCSTRKIPLICKAINVDGKKSGLESAARQGRYEMFQQNIKSGDQLLLAHHADDVAETLMFRLFRGTGIDGLKGPLQQRQLGEGVLLRPWLEYPKSTLVAYLKDRELSYIEDDSNARNDQDRNFIRNEVLPLIAKRWPQAASQMQQTSHLITKHLVAQDTLMSMQFGEDLSESSLNLMFLKNLDSETCDEVLRYWIKKNNIAVPNKKILHEINKAFIKSQPSSKTRVDWSRSDQAQSGGILTFKDGDIIINNK